MARHIDPDNLSTDDLVYLDARANVQRDLELMTGKSWKEIRAALAGKIDSDSDEDEDDPDSDENGSSDEGGSESQGEDGENGEDDEDSDPAETYEEWDYADLQAEVKERGLEVPDRKAETLVSALIDDDLNNTSDEDDDSEEE